MADAAAGGDLGNNLGNIFTESGLRSLAASMMLAGSLNAGATTGSFAEMGKLGEYMATTAIQTATDTVVGGADLQESLLFAVGSAFGRYSAGQIDTNGNIIGVTTEANNNKKYIHPLGYEVVVDEYDNIVDDHVNMGTYNWYNPNNELHEWDSDIGHLALDVFPYLLYGNGENDSITVLQRLKRYFYSPVGSH